MILNFLILIVLFCFLIYWFGFWPAILVTIALTVVAVAAKNGD